MNNDVLSWIPNSLKNGLKGPVTVKLLCGADLLESFDTPGLWLDEDVSLLLILFIYLNDFVLSNIAINNNNNGIY